MATFTTNLKIAKPADNELSWGTTLNANSDLIDSLSPIGSLFVSAAESPSTSLNIRVTAGSYRKADGTIGTFAGTASFALSPSVTNYVWLTDSGTLTAGTAWPTGSQVRLAIVPTGASTVTSVADARIVCMSCTG
jgi:streptogramin lyase